MLNQIVGSLVPVAFVILLGFIAGKRGKLSHSDSLLITRLVLNWIFPSLLLARHGQHAPRAVARCPIHSRDIYCTDGDVRRCVRHRVLSLS